MKSNVDLNNLFEVARKFAKEQSNVNHSTLIGVTDGKAVGTYIEHLFQYELMQSFPKIKLGSSALGIDIPDERLMCDIKVTSIKRPQSSCPYKNARQKIYGLGYNLLVFVYEKIDEPNFCHLDFKHVVLIDKNKTGDFTLTKMIRSILKEGANKEDIVALFEDKSLPGDEVTLSLLAEEVVSNVPEQGYLTISNALQWRLQYSRVISLDNKVLGVLNYDK